MTLDPNLFLTEVSTVFGTLSASNSQTTDSAYDYVEQRLEVLRRFLASEDPPDALNLTTNLFQLLAQIDPNTANQTLTVNMVKDLEALYLTFQSIPASDPDPGGPAVDSDLWVRWRDLSRIDPTINELIEKGFKHRKIGGYVIGDYYTGIATEFLESLTSVDLGANKNVGSLQALVELIYIRKANEVMANNLEVLESDLKITKQTLEALETILGLHNNITAYGKGSATALVENFSELELSVNYTLGPAFNQVTTNMTEIIKERFNDKIEDFFSKPIQPDLSPGIETLDKTLERVLIDDDIEALIAGIASGTGNIVTDFNNSDLPSIPTGATITGASGIPMNYSIFTSKLSTLESAIENQNSSLWFTSEEQRQAFLAFAIDNQRLIAEYNTVASRFNKAMQPINDRLADFGSTILIGSYNVDLPIELQTVTQVEIDIDNFPASLPSSTNLTSLNAVRELNESRIEASAANNAYNNGVSGSNVLRILQLIGGGSGTVEDQKRAGIENVADAIYALSEITDGVELNDATELGPLGAVQFLRDMKNSYEKIQSLIEDLSSDPALEASQSSVLNRLKTVVQDLNEAGIGPLLASASNASINSGSFFATKANRDLYNDFARAWIIDKNDAVADADIGQVGKIQDNISFAISSAQALNDEQKEDTRSFLFVFEEYYKSAAAILSKLTQILEKLAQGISR